MDSNATIEILFCGAHFHSDANSLLLESATFIPQGSLESNSPKSLHHFITALAQDVQSHDLLVRSFTYDLEFRGFLLFLFRRISIAHSSVPCPVGYCEIESATIQNLHVIEHGRELCAIDLDVLLAVLFDRRRLCQPRRPDFRMREDHGGDFVVFEMRVFEFRRSEKPVS